MTADPRILSGTFATDRVSGRVMFPQLPDGDTATGALVSIVAREIGASLDQLYGTRQLRELATREERIRVARDLHDGVLQSLTGVRLEIRALASREVPDATRDRLFAIERALAIEQRELRLFIGSLRPTREPGSNVLAERLDALRERIALEWKTPVTIRVTADPDRVPASIVDAVPLMVHEAVVNALKHAAPSRVSVAIEQRANELLIVVADDGHGFPFRGRLTHEQLRDLQDSPRSLIERVNSLGGRLLVESTNTGSRVEMHLRM
jgi:signal transduction histidine kinase